MMTIDTRRRIDSARDILVGKVPDPKAQVEQITMALIYKFMDDMDKESEELGGKAQFFVKDFEKYSWSKLLDPRLGGFDRLNLYSEALQKMPQNPKLPQLFRNILKDAFLPYRDPETLNLFLKEINEFTYDHSEKLGDAFEYLLSVLGSQGDAGQFRTPRHIIDFIVEVVDPKKDETILDPACGTAGFLISGYKHILKQNTIHKSGDQLTPDEKTKLMQHFVGYDISPDMVKLSLVNMYLHSFPNPNIYEYDTLTSEERWDDTYDVIMANPPFMSPKGGIRPHKRFSIQANRSEVLFVDYIVEHLNIHGRAGVIVPEGIIFQSGNAYKALRKMLVEKYLFAVVSLPGGIFQPYSGVKTSILLMDKQLAKRADSILFVKVENDGFDLGAQRRAIEKNDLTKALFILQKYKQALNENTNVLDVLLDEVAATLATVVEKAKIAKNGDYALSGERYKVNIIKLHQKWPMVELGEVCETTSGGTPIKSRSEYYENGTIPWLKSGEVSQGFIHNSEEKITEAGLKNSSAKIFPVNTVLVAMYGATAGQVGLLKFEAATNQAICGVLPNNKYIPEFLYWVLKSQRDYMVSLSGGGAQPNISQSIIKKIKIPLPPIDIQQEIVEELDGYQKIIEGARQVVENYKTKIDIEPEWEMVKLGSLFKDLEAGVSVNSENRPKNVGEKGILKTSAVTYGVFNPLEHKAIVKSEINRAKVTPKHDNIIISRMNTPLLVGASGYIEKDWDDLFLPDRLWQTIRNHENFSMKFVFYMISSSGIRKVISGISGGTSGSMKNISKEAFLNIEIPLPPFETQKAIVEKIEEEQKLVEANKKLIEIFEQKIKDKIAEVWGEELHEKQGQDASSNGTLKQAQQVQQSEVEQAELELG